MAITKIHPIKHTVGKAINYICDDNKTNDKLRSTALAVQKKQQNLNLN